MADLKSSSPQFDNTGNAVVNIVASGTTSNVIDCRGFSLLGFRFPSGWTTCNVTVQGSIDGINFFTITDYSGTDLSFQAQASRLVPILANLTACFNYFKIVCSAAQTNAVTVGIAAARLFDRAL
jgi:hypothetical protein